MYKWSNWEQILLVSPLALPVGGTGVAFALWQNHHRISFINRWMVRIRGPSLLFYPPEKCCCCLLASCERSPKLARQQSSGSSQRMLLLFPLTSYSLYLPSVLFSFFASKALCAVFCEPLWARFLPGAFFSSSVAAEEAVDLKGGDALYDLWHFIKCILLQGWQSWRLKASKAGDAGAGRGWICPWWLSLCLGATHGLSGGTSSPCFPAQTVQQEEGLVPGKLRT